MDSLTPTRALSRVPSIEKLRDRATQETDKLDISTLTAVVNGLRSVSPLAQIATQVALDETEILDIVADLGSWLIHSHGMAEGEIVSAASMKQQALFQNKKKGVIIPVGFEKRAGEKRRNVAKSVRAIIVHDPDDAELARYLDRKYPSDIGVLSGRDVFVVWRIATLGRLDELDEASDLRSFAQVMVEAFDLLDVTLADAEAAKQSLIAGCVADMEELTSSLVKLAWLNEGRIKKTISLLERAREDASDSAIQTLQRDLAMLTRELAESPRWRTDSIGALTQGQVLRLIERAGLGRAEDARKIETEIRRRLIEAGLKNDLDLLVPDAVAAVRMGQEEVFWNAVEDRASGVSNWRAKLDSALAGA